ncbi:hypothetical protein Fmac_000305 [Flemingia macrophylla]|uniref:Uncharacterized protein n=1 Tax=Flemingia macrophylla TaxID=520843 RepID=A0ABD1NDX0_9FABA
MWKKVGPYCSDGSAPKDGTLLKNHFLGWIGHRTCAWYTMTIALSMVPCPKLGYHPLNFIGKTAIHLVWMCALSVYKQHLTRPCGISTMIFTIIVAGIRH